MPDVGEPMFILVFGELWSDAGKFSGILIIAVAIRFIVSPLSAVLSLEHNIKIGVIW